MHVFKQGSLHINRLKGVKLVKQCIKWLNVYFAFASICFSPAFDLRGSVVVWRLSSFCIAPPVYFSSGCTWYTSKWTFQKTQPFKELNGLLLWVTYQHLKLNTVQKDPSVINRDKIGDTVSLCIGTAVANFEYRSVRTCKKSQRLRSWNGARRSISVGQGNMLSIFFYHVNTSYCVESLLYLII